jgi:hypothetical protein
MSQKRKIRPAGAGDLSLAPQRNRHRRAVPDLSAQHRLIADVVAFKGRTSIT